MAGFVKILLVDDNADVRNLLACMLNESKYLVITAVDGLMGLKIAEAERPDLIITDIDMPRMSGIQMIARLREQQAFSEVPILVVSAYGLGELTAALEAGANLVMPKPVDFNSFISSVSHLLPAGAV